jgi:hypothetical protein
MLEAHVKSTYAKETIMCKKGCFWHLFGYPWEVEENLMWSQLEDILNYVSDRHDVNMPINGEIAELI